MKDDIFDVLLEKEILQKSFDELKNNLKKQSELGDLILNSLNDLNTCIVKIGVDKQTGNKYYICCEQNYLYNGCAENIRFFAKVHKKSSETDRLHDVGSLTAKFIYETKIFEEDERLAYYFLYHLHIKDILINECFLSQGYGSLIMSAFLKQVQKIADDTNGVIKITGMLSDVDNTDDNRERRYKFYNKFGFTITNNKIELKIYPKRAKK